MMPCLFEFYITYLLSVSLTHLPHESAVDTSSIIISIILLLMCYFSKYYDINLVNSCNIVLMPSIYVYVVSWWAL